MYSAAVILVRFNKNLNFLERF